MRQGEAVAGAGAFGELAGCVAVVQGRDAVTVRPSREAAVHGAYLAVLGITHLAERSTVVEGDVGVVGAHHACVAGHLVHGAGDVDVGHDVLHEDGAVGTPYEGAVVYLGDVGAALHTQVADGGVLDECEESAPLARHSGVVIGDGMPAAVEDAPEGTVLRANHQVGVEAVVEVDVAGQEHLHIGASLLHLQVEPVHLLGVLDEIEALFVLMDCVGVGQAADGADAVGAVLVVGLVGVALGIGVGERVVLQFGSVAADGAGGVYALASSAGLRGAVGADGLRPGNSALVAVELIAERSAGDLLLCHLCALGRSDGADVVAVVQDGRAAAEGVAVVGGRAFGELACGVAVVQCGRYASGSEGHEAAVHRAAGVAHLAEGGAAREGDVAVEGAYHAAVARHAAAFARDGDVRHDVLHEHLAVAVADEGAEVDAPRHDVAFHTEVADGGSANEAEEAAVVVAEVVAVGDGVSLSVELAGIGCGLCADHQVGCLALAQVDVGRQLHFQPGVPFGDGLCQGCQVLGGAYLTDTVLNCQTLQRTVLCIGACSRHQPEDCRQEH